MLALVSLVIPGDGTICRCSGTSGLPFMLYGRSPASISDRQLMHDHLFARSRGWSGQGSRGFFSNVRGTVVFQWSPSPGNGLGCVHRGLPCFSALQ